MVSDQTIQDTKKCYFFEKLKIVEKNLRKLN